MISAIITWALVVCAVFYIARVVYKSYKGKGACCHCSEKGKCHAEKKSEIKDERTNNLNQDT